MKKGHEERFMSKLEQALPKKQKRNRFQWWSIAASVAIVIGLGIYFYPSDEKPDEIIVPKVVDNGNVDENVKTISLGDLSPEFKRIENYYVANINLELSGLEFGQKDKVLVDGYMERLAELDEEYRRLNQELNEIGPNDNTISALIGNLQLRLQLLQKLKTKLNQLKTSKNEQKSASII